MHARRMSHVVKPCILVTLLMLPVLLQAQSNVYDEDFDTNPNITVDYTTQEGEYFEWDAVNEIYKIRVLEENENTDKYAYTPTITTVTNASFLFSVDLKLVETSSGFWQGFLFDNDESHPGSNIRIGYTEHDMVWRITDSSGHAYTTPTFEMNEWYSIGINYNHIDHIAELYVIKRDSNDTLYHNSSASFTLTSFNKFALGTTCVNGDGTAGEMYYDNISLAVIDLDTMQILPVHTCLKDSDIIIPIKFACHTPTAGFTLPVKWDNPALVYDSASFVGTAVEGWDMLIDSGFVDTSIVLLGAANFSGMYIPADDQVTLANLYFNLDQECIPEYVEDSLLISFDTALVGIEGQELLFADSSHPAHEFAPAIDFGILTTYLYRPGDVNFDCAVNLLDILGLIDTVYLGYAGPTPLDAGDVNHDCALNLLDILGLIDAVYIIGGRSLECGCHDWDEILFAPLARQISTSSESGGLLTASASENKTIVNLTTDRDLAGLDLTLSTTGNDDIEFRSLIDGIEIFAGREGNQYHVGLLDIDGRMTIPAGTNALFEIIGSAEIVSAFGGDDNLNTVNFQIANNADYTATIPATFELEQNHPNPFNPTTTIGFSLPHPQHTQLIVYNIAGQKVRMVLDSRLEAGRHAVIWDGKDDSGTPVASGMYFYRITAGDFTESKKMLLLK